MSLGGADDPTERFALVRPDGTRTGSATRAECHADPSLVHLSLHVAVITAAGPLWQLRGPHKDSAPLAWDHACSGHVGADEPVEQAALRELAEETGIAADAGALERLGQRLVSLGNETELTLLFRLRHDGPFRFAPPEVAGLAVLPADRRPAQLSPSCAVLSAFLDAERPGWDDPAAW